MAQHLRRQRVAKDVCPLGRSGDVGRLHSVGSDRGDRPTVREGNVRRHQADKNGAAARGWATVRQIRRERLPDVCRQWHRVGSAALAADRQLPAAPVDIVQGEAADLIGPQSEASQQHQDSVVASAHRGLAVAVRKDLMNLHARQRLRECRESPARNPGDACRQVALDLASKPQVTQEGAKSGAKLLHVDGYARLSAAAHEREQSAAVNALHTRGQAARKACAARV